MLELTIIVAGLTGIMLGVGGVMALTEDGEPIGILGILLGAFLAINAVNSADSLGEYEAQAKANVELQEEAKVSERTLRVLKVRNATLDARYSAQKKNNRFLQDTLAAKEGDLQQAITELTASHNALESLNASNKLAVDDLTMCVIEKGELEDSLEDAEASLAVVRNVLKGK